ncbi:hydrolase [Lithospermum erythrorhizon]|uniref:Hydrolase n=1 Tax=Lithospermum erythrorhizon TaxID=34254 RepID=A0AAV3RYM2_LITER
MMMMKVALPLGLLLLFGIWMYISIVPPPPKICGTPGGPPVTGARITLRDGRHLAYEEYGVPKEMAKYKIIYVHGHSQNKRDPFPSTPGLFEEFQAYIVAFDRPGYGESDPDSKRTVKSTTLDIEELADQLELGDKFHVIGYSSGGAITWGCLKYIPHRLAGAILMAPGISFWWPGLPKDLSEQALKQQEPWMQWNFLIAHYAPWLLYWWNTQNTQVFFPQRKEIHNPQSVNTLSNSDPQQNSDEEYSTQQGLYESFLRDFMVGFGKWEFEPLDLENSFNNSDVSIQLWQGGADEAVPVVLQRYIVERLPWIEYHEVPNVGHKFALENSVKRQIMMSLVMNKKVSSSSINSA